MSIESADLNENEVLKNTEVVDLEKLAEDFANLAENNEFTQIELLAQEMKGRLENEQIAEALTSAVKVLKSRNFHTSPAKPDMGTIEAVLTVPRAVSDVFKLDTMNSLSARIEEIRKSFEDGGRNA